MYHAMKILEGEEGKIHAFLTTALDRGKQTTAGTYCIGGWECQ
jgi:hypothetical protein